MKNFVNLPKRVVLLCLFLGVANVPPGWAAESAAQAQLKLFAEGFSAPTALIPFADGSGRLLVADQAGVVYLLGKDGKRQEQPFLDLRSKIVKQNQGMEERGLLCIALHPQFRENRKLYVYYSAPKRAGAPADWDHTAHVSEFRVSTSEPPVALPDSERVLLQIDEPDWNHNSGRIAFGPDGYLYMSVGDGGAPNDVGVRGHAPEGNGQHLQTLLGKVLRIDVDHGEPHGIPSDNPFADGVKGMPEIYAYGVRNPWGLSFDRGGSHSLILTDVGQDRWEEVNLIVKGGNYGWRVREGYEGFDPKNSNKPPENAPKVDADGKPFIDPVMVYKTLRGMGKDPNSYGVTSVGGYVYRGKALPELTGYYVFADWSRSMGFGMGTLIVASGPDHAGTDGRWTSSPLRLPGHPDGHVTGFVWALGQDEDGELYVLTNGANMVHGDRGKVYKLVAP